MTVLTPDTIIEHAFKYLEGTSEIGDITLSDDFNICVKLDGERWNGTQIDYKVAKFILELQHDILGIINATTGSTYTLKNVSRQNESVVVKVIIKDGCTEIIAQTKEVFKEFFKNMTGKEKVAAVAVAAAIFSTAWVGISHVNTNKEIALKGLDEQTKIKAIESSNKAIEALRENSRAMHSLVHKMEEHDTITVGRGKALSREEMRALLPAKAKSVELPGENFKVDGRYEMPEYNYENQIAYIRREGVKKFKASTKMLDETSKRELQKTSNAADLNNTFPIVDLHVIIVVKKGKIDEAFVVGTGPIRDGAEDIATVLQKEKKKLLTPQQASLFGGL